jgi:hypothetical protein
MKKNALLRLIDEELAMPPVHAGRALGLGRRRALAAVKEGTIPTTAAGTVPTSWVRDQLQLAGGTKSAEPARAD